MPWSPILDRRMRSDMLYEHISHRISIPIHKIFAFSPGIDDKLGYPFILMSRARKGLSSPQSGSPRFSCCPEAITSRMQRHLMLYISKLTIYFSAFCHFLAFPLKIPEKLGVFEGKSPPISRFLSQLFANRHLAFLTRRFSPFSSLFSLAQAEKS